jgi:Prefoldin subunit
MVQFSYGVLTFQANVMLAYPIDEAKTLLTEKLSGQQISMKTCQEDLEFLREQITTMEVNIGMEVQFAITDDSADV